MSKPNDSGTLMRRLKIQLPPSSMEQLKNIASQRYTSISTVVRHSLRLAELISNEIGEGNKILVTSQSGAIIKEIVLSLDPIVHSTVVDSYGAPIDFTSPVYEHIVSDLVRVSDDLLRKIYSTPEAIYQLTPRQFEEVVAELLIRQGYAVELTPPTRDGGLDIFVATKNSLGSFLYVVECKRFAMDHPVGVEFVRGLYGVVEQTRATAGILATTSRFTSGAREWQSTLEHRISLRDYQDLRQWLNLALRGRATRTTPNPTPAADGQGRR